MALAQRIGRSRHRLILLVLTAITLLTLDLNQFGPLGTAQRFVRDLLHPVTELADWAFTPVSNAWNAAFNYDDLEADVARLEAENAALKAQQIIVESEREAFQNLLEATNITYLPEVPFEPAAVVRGAVGNFDSDVITIDKGSQNNIQSGMAVVTEAGLVGRVDRVDVTTSTVQLISDRNLVVGVRLVDTDQVGLGQAVAGSDGLFEIDQGIDWPEDGDESLLPSVGTAVVTASVSRYPAEIPIGWVEAVEPANGGLTAKITVRLSNNVGDLAYVSVLLVEGVDQVQRSEPVPSTIVPLTVETTPESEEGDAEGADGEGDP